MTVGQILWVNLVSTVTLALALGFEPGEPESMRRDPRPEIRGISSRACRMRIALRQPLDRWHRSRGLRNRTAVVWIVDGSPDYGGHDDRAWPNWPTCSMFEAARIVVNRQVFTGTGWLLLRSVPSRSSSWDLYIAPFMQVAFVDGTVGTAAWGLLWDWPWRSFSVVEMYKLLTRKRERVSW